MSVIGFKDIFVCSLVLDVQNVSWTKPIWVAQIQLTSSGSLALSEGWWDQCVDSECICLGWFMTPGLPFWQPSSAISLHLTLSLSLSWQQDFLSVPGHRAPTFPMQPVAAGSASTHRSRRAPPAWSASVCVCV